MPNPRRTNSLLEISKMLDRERALLENMQKLANTGELNADLPAFDLAVNDSLRRINILNDQLKKVIQSFAKPVRFDPPKPDTSPEHSHARVEYLRQALGLPPQDTPTFDVDMLIGVEDDAAGPYDLNDPKHPTYRERMIDAADEMRNIPSSLDSDINFLDDDKF